MGGSSLQDLGTGDSLVVVRVLRPAGGHRQRGLGDPVKGSKMAARRIGLIGGAIVLASVAAVVIIASVSREERPTTFIAGSEEFVAGSLPELAKPSDAIIEGTVIEVGPGRTIDLGEGMS